MLKTLKYYLGIQSLEADRNFYQKQWKQMNEQFCAINDHLVEIKDIIESRDFNFCLLGKIKEMIDAHDKNIDQKILNNHLNILTRLGMILSVLDPSKVDLLLKEEKKPLQDDKTEEDLKKVLTCLESFQSHYVSPNLIVSKTGIKEADVKRLLALLAESHQIEMRDDNSFRSIPLYKTISKALIEAMSRESRKIFHYLELSQYVPFTAGQIIPALSSLVKQKKIERVEPGRYRLTQRKNYQNEVK